ncbi:MAG TPA: dihydrolipoamide acetyltransferase family protein, partial [Saprospiraceae bacterium]|nr:dihydrolipoamide acetyltransferase family protein [Saprospiraceae bacterium]
MADVIRMPRLSDTMTEGVIKSWIKKVGDSVKPGDVLAEVETDKATMDLEAFQEGILLHIAVTSGAITVDGIIAIIGKKDEDFSSLLKQDAAPAKNETVAATVTSPTAEVKSQQSVESKEDNSDSRIKASPLAKSMAKDKGLDLSKVSGSGENGRIVRRDLENISTSSSSTPASSAISYQTQGDRTVELSQMRKTIAKRLAESKFSAPHFYLTSEIDMDTCVAAREQLNKLSEIKISFNDIIVKACAAALRKNLDVNVSWMGDKMVYHNDIHIGVAVAIEDGLVVP